MNRNKLFFIILVLFTVVAMSLGNGFFVKSENKEKIFDISRGINLNEWLEKRNLDSIMLNSAITHELIDSLALFGFDHVRIPISEEHLFDESMNEYTERVKILLDRVDYCISKGIKIIVDLHITRNHRFATENNVLFTSDSARASFIKVWEKMQNIFSHYSVSDLAYECLNEPAAPIKEPEKWNQVLFDWISFIRKKEKNRVLFIGSNRGNQIWTLKFLKLPLDPYLVYTFHYYEPFVLTHYNREEYDSLLNGEVPIYPGQPLSFNIYAKMSDSEKKKYSYTQKLFNVESIRHDFRKVFDWAKRNKIQVNLGEYGCRRFVSEKTRQFWLTDIATTAREFGFSYTLWGINGGGFGIQNKDHSFDKMVVKSLEK